MGFLNEFTPTINSDNRRRHLCQKKCHEMTVGSSAVHTFSLPFSYTEYISYCEVIYKQGLEVILTKKDFEVQEENELDCASSILTVKLTPAETCLFKPISRSTFVQVKMVNNLGETSYSDPTEIHVLDSLDGGKSTTLGYMYKNNINKYLVEMAFDSLDYENAYAYYKTDTTATLGDCTSIRCDGFLGRNFDWYYSDEPTFIIKTTSNTGFYATIGCTGALSGLDLNCEDTYKLLPFCLCDGINEKGLAMSTNVCPSLNNTATRTIGSKYDDVCAKMMIRYCLDRYASVEELKRELPKHTSIFPMKYLSDLGYELHCLIADPTTTTILEIIDNEIKFIDPIEDKKAVIANFHLNGVILNDMYNTVYGPADVLEGHVPTVENKVEPFGQGLERHNFAVTEMSKINGEIDEQSLRAILNGLSYTNSYITSKTPADPIWYTELVGDYKKYIGKDYTLTIDSEPEKFTPVLEISGEMFKNRERGDNQTWFTEHSSIYDLENKKLYLVCQEDNDIEYVFTL